MENTLFEAANVQKPLAERMRPTQLSEVYGQEHLIGEGKILSLLSEQGRLPSMIFWGPPGTGKTTLARILARSVRMPFVYLSAIQSGVKDIREAEDRARVKGGLVLFLDEIHRFNKSQQDSLLAAVESGLIVLMGATTENPSFEVNHALLSRCQIFILKSLEAPALRGLVERAIQEDVWLKTKRIEVLAWDVLLRLSGGDARKLLNTLEVAVAACGQNDCILTEAHILQSVQKSSGLYDKGGDYHYDIISAFIKTIRGGDGNAALYWLARMMEAGEDPTFIARRLLILASEDIGLANPNALLLATSCFHAVQMIGYPECDLILAETTLYLAGSPKSNSVYKAIRAAQKAVREQGNLQVPIHLRNAPTGLMKQLNFGKDYLYPHDFPGNFVTQSYWPEGLKPIKFFHANMHTKEKEIQDRFDLWWGSTDQNKD